MPKILEFATLAEDLPCPAMPQQRLLACFKEAEGRIYICFGQVVSQNVVHYLFIYLKVVLSLLSCGLYDLRHIDLTMSLFKINSL